MNLRALIITYLTNNITKLSLIRTPGFFLSLTKIIAQIFWQ